MIKDLVKVGKDVLALGMLLVARKIAFAACRLANKRPVVIFTK